MKVLRISDVNRFARIKSQCSEGEVTDVASVLQLRVGVDVGVGGHGAHNMGMPCTLTKLGINIWVRATEHAQFVSRRVTDSVIVSILFK